MLFFLSDSLFSLIIFIYVAVTFCYIFYAFCWREAPRKELTEEEKKVSAENGKTKSVHFFLQNIPMITEQLSKVEEKETTAEV